MTAKPPNMDAPDPSDKYVRMLAGIEVALGKLANDHESIKGELRKIAPRLDTLAAEVRESARLVHHQARIIETLSNETSDLHQTKVALETLIEEIRTESAARALELNRAIKAIEWSQTFLEGRVRDLRDEVADHVAVGDEGPSGVMQKPNV